MSVFYVQKLLLDFTDESGEDLTTITDLQAWCFSPSNEGNTPDVVITKTDTATGQLVINDATTGRITIKVDQLDENGIWVARLIDADSDTKIPWDGIPFPVYNLGNKAV
jgi:hypothetical protein